MYLKKGFTLIYTKENEIRQLNQSTISRNTLRGGPICINCRKYFIYF